MAVASKKFIATALLIGFASISASADPVGPSASAPAFGITYIEVMPNSADDVASLLKSSADDAAHDAGALGYVALRRIGHPDQFAVLEGWADKKSMEAHTNSVGAKQLEAKLRPMLKAPVNLRPQDSFIVDSESFKSALAHPDNNVVIALTHVDIAPATKDAGLARVKAMADSAKEPGNAAYEIVWQANRPNHISLLEIWKNKASLLAHETRSQTVQFRYDILPLSGAPYDERTYSEIN